MKSHLPKLNAQPSHSSRTKFIDIKLCTLTTLPMTWDKNKIHSIHEHMPTSWFFHKKWSLMHPYWYARIISIYHTLIWHNSSPDPIPIEFLLVHWYGLDLDHVSCFGWKMHQLPKIRFVPDHPDARSPAFGPAQVIWGVHLIPSFTEELTSNLLGPSSACLKHEGDFDWLCYYVNMY